MTCSKSWEATGCEFSARSGATNRPRCRHYHRKAKPPSSLLTEEGIGLLMIGLPPCTDIVCFACQLAQQERVPLVARKRFRTPPEKMTLRISLCVQPKILHDRNPLPRVCGKTSRRVLSESSRSGTSSV